MARNKVQKEHYVDNARFYEEMKIFITACEKAKELGEQRPIMSNYIGECFMKIAKRLSFHPWFINYSYKDDMIGDAVENCVMYCDRFNPEKSKQPFAYFTQISWFAFRRKIKKERKEQYVKYKVFEKARLSDVLSGEDIDALPDDIKSQWVNSGAAYDNISDFITAFEKSEQDAKDKKKIVKDGALEAFLK